MGTPMQEEELRVGARDRGSDQAAAEHDAPSAAGNGVDLTSATRGHKPREFYERSQF